MLEKFPAILIPAAALKALLGPLRTTHLLQASPYQELPDNWVPLSSHPAYAALGYHTKSREGFISHKKSAVALAPYNDIHWIRDIENDRDLTEIIPPPFYLCVQTKYEPLMRDDPWGVCGRIKAKMTTSTGSYRKQKPATMEKFVILVSPHSTVSPRSRKVPAGQVFP